MLLYNQLFYITLARGKSAPPPSSKVGADLPKYIAKSILLFSAHIHLQIAEHQEKVLYNTEWHVLGDDTLRDVIVRNAHAGHVRVSMPGQLASLS